METPTPTVLIIDDNEHNRYTFSRYLKQVHFDVWVAKTGEEGLALARKGPSLIMLDIQLPDTTGYEICRLLKTDPMTESIPVLHTSATFTESSDLAYGLEGGADGYLIQPIDAQELTATVKALLRVRAAEMTAKALASQWRTTFDSISDGLCILDPAGKIVRFNSSFIRLFPQPQPKIGELFQDYLQIACGSLVSHWQSGSEINLQGRWFKVTFNYIKYDEISPQGGVWVVSDINSRYEAEIKLKALNSVLEQHVSERTASLEQAIQQLEQFTYAVSHDLRAPLRAMQGYSNAVIEDCSDKLDEDAVAYLKRIASNATRLDKMIVDLLSFSKASLTSPILTKLLLSSVVQEVIDVYPGLKSPDAEVVVDVNHSVFANRSGLVQALSNIMGNAAKFVAKGITPNIKVWSERQDNRIRVWIEDNGIGVPREFQHRLFGMFERVFPDTEYEGTGVGLAISRRVIERMGGAIGLEAEGLNGSRFWIELPEAQ